MRIVMASVAALAFVGTSAAADPGNDADAGKPQTAGKTAAVNKPEDHGKQSPAKPANAPQKDPAKMGPTKMTNNAGDYRASDETNPRNSGNHNKIVENDRQHPRQKQGEQADVHSPDNTGTMQKAIRATEREEHRERATERILTSNETGPYRWAEAREHGLIDGCPPGLAKKNNGCMPPGQVRKDPWQSILVRPDWWGYRDWRDSARYYDGYLLRYNGNRAEAYIPLLGGALSLGAAWPESYRPIPLPNYYQDFYGLGPSYRYADNVLYRVDPKTAVISSIAALLTGDDIVIGRPLPAYYDVYNVPYSYRERYADGADAIYRYSDGYVYRINPKTRLIQAAIELLS